MCESIKGRLDAHGTHHRGTAADATFRGPSTIDRAGNFCLVVNADFETGTIPLLCRRGRAGRLIATDREGRQGPGRSGAALALVSSISVAETLVRTPVLPLY
jgi:hypothetical protein